MMYNTHTLTELAKEFDIPLVEAKGTVTDAGSFAEQTRQNEDNIEGFILRFDDGHMLKIKTEKYLRIHRVKDQISNDRRLLDLIINNGIDDVLPNLDEGDRQRVIDYEAKYRRAFENLLSHLTALAIDCKEKATMSDEFFDNGPTLDRKMVATILLPDSGLDKKLYGIIFGYIDGKDVGTQLLEWVQKAVSNTKRYNELADLLGLDHTTDLLEE